MKKIRFSKGLRIEAFNEVRALHKRKEELLEMYDVREKELNDLRREISEISEVITASCAVFHFEYRGVRDESGHLVPSEDGSTYKKDYFFEGEEDTPE